VISGALLGFWLAVSYELIARPTVVKHITDLTNRKKPTKMWKLIIYSCLAYFFISGIGFIVFIIDIEVGSWRVNDGTLLYQDTGVYSFNFTVWKTWG